MESVGIQVLGDLMMLLIVSGLGFSKNFKIQEPSILGFFW
jgi:hypothetical protein